MSPLSPLSLPNPDAVALVACCGQKLAAAAPAARLYQSPLFKLSAAYARRHCGRWAILSAKYGLVLPDEALEPYDLTLADLGPAARRAWAELAGGQVRAAFGSGPYVALAGSLYLGALAGLPYTDPLAGLKIGERMAFLKRALARPTAGLGLGG